MRRKIGFLSIALVLLLLNAGCFLAADGQFYSDQECQQLANSEFVGSGFFYWLGGCN